jgi:hypothetical protein
MPTDHGVGLYDDQRLLPPRPEADEGDPEGAIKRREPGPALAPRGDLELLPKRELNEGLILAASQQREEAADE